MARPTDEARLAVLIDADNANAQHLERLLVEIAKYGTASVRRAYGDWTSTRLGKWKPELLAHSVQPMQQYSYTTGKNATDSALIIDAMDLLHGGTVGSNLSRLASDFDTRTWGYAKLKDLMEAHPSYEMTSRKASEGRQSNAYVRKAKRK